MCDSFGHSVRCAVCGACLRALQTPTHVYVLRTQARQSCVSRVVLCVCVLVCGRYVVFPAVSELQFQGLNCVRLNKTSGHSYLKADTRLDCSSDQYRGMSCCVSLVCCLVPCFALQ